MTRNTHVSRRGLALAGGGTIILGLAAWGFAATTARRPTTTVAQPATGATAQRQTPGAGSAGMRVAIQPESGMLVAPSAEQVRDLDAGKVDDATGIVIETRADGGQHANVQGHFMNYEVARRGADGKLQKACVENPQAVQQFLQGQGAPATNAPAANGLEVK